MSMRVDQTWHYRVLPQVYNARVRRHSEVLSDRLYIFPFDR